jgi:hypothetical protein
VSAEPDAGAATEAPPVTVDIDAQRTCLQRVFFTQFQFETMAELVDAVAEVRVGLATIAKSQDVRSTLYSGWVYWLLFLRGFLEYTDAGRLEDDNVYLEYMVRYYAPRRHDPGVVESFRNPETASERIMARFATLSYFALAAEEGTLALDDVEPVVVTVRRPMPEYPLRVYPVAGKDSIGAALVDGWHRLFGAHLFGIESIPGVVVVEDGS